MAPDGYNKLVLRKPSACRLCLGLLAGLLLLAGCPQGSKSEARNPLIPTAEIPKNETLTQYENLRLGMSELELSQIYNAPDGKGKGFTRTFETSGNVTVHTISFELHKDQPRRRLLLEFYRGQLCRVVDRRDGMTGKQADAWLAECRKRYGTPTSELLQDAQWEWRDGKGLILTFTRDNSSAQSMSANTVLVHQPTLDAAQEFLREWEAEHRSETGGAAGAPPGA